MKAEGSDASDISKQVEVLNDTLTVLPDCRLRLQKYARELTKVMANSPLCCGELPEDASEDLRKLILEGRQLLAETSEELGEASEVSAATPGGGGGSAEDGEAPGADFAPTEEF